MKIQKLKEEEVFIKRRVEHKILVNDKELRIYEETFFDNDLGLQDFSVDMDNEDKERLSDEEMDFIDDNINDIIDLKVEEELKEE